MRGESAQEVSMVSPSVGRKEVKWSLWPSDQDLSSPGHAPSCLSLKVTLGPAQVRDTQRLGLGSAWGWGHSLSSLKRKASWYSFMYWVERDSSRKSE